MNDLNILVIDDEVQIRRLLAITLNAEGYKIQEAENGKSGLLLAASHPPDLILLDLGLPDEDGQVILSKLREWYLSPIIILSVRNSESDIVQALDHGASDYLCKPFRTGELLARIRNAIRNNQEKDNTSIIQMAGMSIDLSGHIVRKNGTLVHLTSTEFKLLSLLARNQDRVLTHQFILKEIWGPGHVEHSQYLRVYVAQLRNKIEEDPNHPKIITTVSGIGYRFSEEEKND
jgi:two-component system KDP operon response regulator KdpE